MQKHRTDGLKKDMVQEKMTGGLQAAMRYLTPACEAVRRHSCSAAEVLPAGAAAAASQAAQGDIARQQMSPPLLRLTEASC